MWIAATVSRGSLRLAECRGRRLRLALTLFGFGGFDPVVDGDGDRVGAMACVWAGGDCVDGVGDAVVEVCGDGCRTGVDAGALVDRLGGW
jgi:hypothetical protein